MRKTNVPLQWPKSLGGWGMPGKPTAPTSYRKLAGIILNGQRSIQKELMNVHLVARAPKHLRGSLRLAIEMVSATPERIDSNADPTPLLDLTAEITSRMLSYSSFDPTYSKISRKERHQNDSLDKLASRIKRIHNKSLKIWPGVKPMDENKAARLHAQVENKMVDRQFVDNILYYLGFPDRAGTLTNVDPTITDEANKQSETTMTQPVAPTGMYEGLTRELDSKMRKVHNGDTDEVYDMRSSVFSDSEDDMPLLHGKQTVRNKSHQDDKVSPLTSSSTDEVNSFRNIAQEQSGN